MNPDHSSEPCKHVGLAQSAVGSVSLCPGCGVLHVSLHYLTLRFEPDAYRELVRLLALAQVRFDRAAQAGDDQAAPAHGSACPGRNLH